MASALRDDGDLPSTFLSHYYPEGRHASTALPSYAELAGSSRERSHLLDGVDLRPGQLEMPARKRSSPKYELSPETFARSLPGWPKAKGSSRPPMSTMRRQPDGQGEDTGGGRAFASPRMANQQSPLRNSMLSNEIASEESNQPPASMGLAMPVSRERGGPDVNMDDRARIDRTPSATGWRGSTLPELTPHSNGYPGNLVGMVQLPEISRSPGSPGDRADEGVTGEDYARVSHMPLDPSLQIRSSQISWPSARVRVYADSRHSKSTHTSSAHYHTSDPPPLRHKAKDTRTTPSFSCRLKGCRFSRQTVSRGR